jgi:hypothetical protein
MTLKSIFDEENVHHINASKLLVDFIEDFFEVKNLHNAIEETLEFEMEGISKTFHDIGQMAVDTAIKLQTA